MNDAQAHIDDLRKLANLAKGVLYEAIEDACPGPHDPKQHRDRRPPWCSICGRDSAGHVWRATPTTRTDEGDNHASEEGL